MFEQLQAYPNIRIRHVKIQNYIYIKDTPLDVWYRTDIIKKSKWPKIQMIDILRFLTLWKYGIYLDLDLVVIISIEHLTNFDGAEDWYKVAVDILGFDTSKLDRHIVNECIHEIRNNFQGDIWGYNAPSVVTRMLKRICLKM
ncbi:uncharacterized protein LOC122719578 [Apis laboriosa]|uniref:uncharacterized protein LOC122719578 n=1 Tax=Apis laboriosa TaxID=183418 RepID=UPI001CC70171|nr:uncharacterized protein LOC122719578 [Apis laboriosa]